MKHPGMKVTQKIECRRGLSVAVEKDPPIAMIIAASLPHAAMTRSTCIHKRLVTPSYQVYTYIKNGKSAAVSRLLLLRLSLHPFQRHRCFLQDVEDLVEQRFANATDRCLFGLVGAQVVRPSPHALESYSVT